MNELKNLIAAYQQTDFQQKKAALATVVRVKGSSYRGPGARMYLTNDGRWTGAISGGCLEGDALRKARTVMNSGLPQLITYDTTDDENPAFKVALGCNGVVDVLLEPVSALHNPMTTLERLPSFSNGKPVAMATVFCSEVAEALAGEQILLSPDGFQVTEHGNRWLKELIAQDLQHCLSVKQSRTVEYSTDQGTLEVFLEVFEPDLTLAIYGGGFDARPLSAMAQLLGWGVSVADECVAHLIPQHFPGATLHACQTPHLPSAMQHSAYTAVVLMSHNYHFDLSALKAALATEAPYIGILGPRKRTEKMFAQLETEGVFLTEADMARIYSPIGLDIGASSPEEIALSVLAEIKAAFSLRSGGSLRHRQGSIHDKANGEVLKPASLLAGKSFW